MAEVEEKKGRGTPRRESTAKPKPGQWASAQDAAIEVIAAIGGAKGVAVPAADADPATGAARDHPKSISRSSLLTASISTIRPTS